MGSRTDPGCQRAPCSCDQIRFLGKQAATFAKGAQRLSRQPLKPERQAQTETETEKSLSQRHSEIVFCKPERETKLYHLKSSKL